MTDPKVPLDALRKFSSGTPMSLGDVESIGAYIRAVDASAAAARDEELANAVSTVFYNADHKDRWLEAARAARAHIAKEQQ